MGKRLAFPLLCNNRFLYKRTTSNRLIASDFGLSSLFVFSSCHLFVFSSSRLSSSSTAVGDDLVQNGDQHHQQPCCSSALVGKRKAAARLSWQEPTNCRRDDDNRPAPLTTATSNTCLHLVETSAGSLPPSQHRFRRASFEDQRPLQTKSNYELRRCKSEVTQPTDPSARGTEAGNPPGIVQNALTSKDKIQAKSLSSSFILNYILELYDK